MIAQGLARMELFFFLVQLPTEKKIKYEYFFLTTLHPSTLLYSCLYQCYSTANYFLQLDVQTLR